MVSTTNNNGCQIWVGKRENEFQLNIHIKYLNWGQETNIPKWQRAHFADCIPSLKKKGQAFVTSLLIFSHTNVQKVSLLQLKKALGKK